MSAAEGRLEAVERLRTVAAARAGLSAAAISPHALHGLALDWESRPGGLAELVARAEAGDKIVSEALLGQVSVGETYFFRQPEHFEQVAEVLLPGWLARGSGLLRVWSAGCATGEEAYSLAAFLGDALLAAGSAARVDVLGTDLVEQRLASARTGVYRAWSVRASARLLSPLLEPDGDALRVASRLLPSTRFLAHNLLDPPPETGFDLVFCRNVLIYFTTAAAALAGSHLAASLAPGGLLAFATMDLGEPPEGLQRVGPSELNLFRRPEAPVPLLAAARPLPAAPTPAPASPPAPLDPVELHLRALLLIERGKHQAAAQLLRTLESQLPEYLPGILEQALLLARVGEPSRAGELMREILRRTHPLAADSIIEGPEGLSVSFYRATAEAFLGRQEPKR